MGEAHLQIGMCASLVLKLIAIERPWVAKINRFIT